MSPATALRRGWTTGSCATAAAKAAWSLLIQGECPDPVVISLPGGKEAGFALNGAGRNSMSAWASVIKDAGDDPDVTNGALIRVDIAIAPPALESCSVREKVSARSLSQACHSHQESQPSIPCPET